MDILDVLFTIHEMITNFISILIFTIPTTIEGMIWYFKLIKDPIYGEKIDELFCKDKKYRYKVTNYFVKKCSKMQRIRRKFEIYCCPIHVKW